MLIGSGAARQVGPMIKPAAMSHPRVGQRSGLYIMSV
jgi:hypothetical protein